ncbi:MAG: PIN domain-containing protein [Burkholderiaceae bacterium]
MLDTSVWVRHFRESNTDVVNLLENELVLTHDFVIGELACGGLKSRLTTIGYLKELGGLPGLSVDEVLILVESKTLHSRGIGLIDAQLLAAVIVTPDVTLWTFDKRLHQIATELDVAYAPG